MNETKKTAYQGRSLSIGTGTTSLLMIFTLLCFATLALLSLSTAVSNRRTQNRGQEAARLLAVAKGQAAQSVAELDEELVSLNENLATGKDFQKEALRLAQELGWQAGEEENHILINHTVDANNTLLTEIKLSPQGATERYTLVRQISNLAQGWKPEGKDQLWPG